MKRRRNTLDKLDQRRPSQDSPRTPMIQNLSPSRHHHLEKSLVAVAPRKYKEVYKEKKKE